jgi:protein-S-isoprenylcysteine O-methyltransferase Ste14
MTTTVTWREAPEAARRGRFGAMAAYASLFVVALPLLLAAWAWRLDRVVHLPMWGTQGTGIAIATAGLALMIAATRALWTFGRGLPMSPFPPEQLVTRGAYRLVPHPIYLGAIGTSVGLAIAARSPAGLWIVSPMLAAAAAAFVLGYEGDATFHRFGATVPCLICVPSASDAVPRLSARLAFYLVAFLPWLLAYEAVNRLGPPFDSRSSYVAWDSSIPVVAWTEVIYAATYVFVLLAPLAARRERDLRQMALRGLGATAAIVAFYLLVPFVAPAKLAPAGSVWAPLLAFERILSPRPTAALPAFHVVWACLACAVYGARWPRMRGVLAVFALAVGLSCVTVGMHSMLDVVAGFIAYLLVARAGVLWRSVCRATEAVANSWHEWQVGPIRFLSHGVFAATGAAIGAGVAVRVAGTRELWWIVAMTFGAEVGAAVWAQLLEGSPQLLRPYGYFGGVAGVIVVGVVAVAVGQDAWLLVAAMAVGGCFTQAIGRLRCLRQGCCHGRPIAATWGIRYTHPRSRVLRLAGLGGVPLHPAPLYSILSTVVTGCVLLRLWAIGAPLTFVAGSYLILVGLARFVEEHYRGEPQTVSIGGLHIYQWLAIGFVAVGAVVTSLGGAYATLPPSFDPGVVPVIAAIAAISYPAFGIDFPASNRRFSRLA